MSSEVETSIWLAIKSRVETIPITIDFAWPAQKYSPSVTTPFIRVAHLPAEPDRIMVAYGKQHWRKGVLMLTLVSRLGPDVSVFNQMTAKIARHFKDGTSMRHGDICVTVYKYPHVQAGYEDNGFWTVPISIFWRAFA